MPRLSVLRSDSKHASVPHQTWVDAVLATLPPLLTTDEAREVLRTSRRNLYRWIATGRLHAVKTAAGTSGRVLVPRPSIEAYLRALDPA
jgi:excisionase family DNA binding protein